MNGNSEPKLGGYEYVLFLGIVMFAIALRGGTRACSQASRAPANSSSEQWAAPDRDPPRQ